MSVARAQPEGKYTFDKWRSYPANVAGCYAMVADGQGLSRMLSEKSGRLFEGEDGRMDVEVFEITEEGKGSRGARWSCRFSSGGSLERHVARMPLPTTRIISISQQNSLAPLGISEETMRKILTYYQVTPNFLTNLFACGDLPQASDAGSGNFVHQTWADGGFEIMYTLRYVEHNGRSHGSPWSTRHTAIYHQRSAEGKNVWIVLHPREESVLHKRLGHAISNVETFNSMQTQPLNLHFLLLSSYGSNWQRYLEHLTSSFTDAADMALTVDLADAGECRLSFGTLQSLRHLSDKVAPMAAILQASIGTIERICQAYHSCQLGGEKSPQFEGVNQLQTYAYQLQGALKGVELLQTRIQGILNLLVDALNIRSQAVAADLSNNMLSLTKRSVDDSATVRVVGIVSLVYLPATFVATLLGMDFFAFETSTLTIEIAKDFWIYLVISIPLTLLTVGSWIMLLARKKARKAANDSLIEEESRVILSA